MARYRYWMVFLPKVEPTSFMLFVEDSTGANKLRNYASGIEMVVGQPGADAVFKEAKFHFPVTPHRVGGAEACQHWYGETLAYNHSHLGRGINSPQAAVVPAGGIRTAPATDGIVQGRAKRGSQRQIQDYVNSHPTVLTEAILDRLPPVMRELGARIRWVSPLAGENYREYRDAEFLERVGLGQLTKALAEYWPNRGPSWDALGILSDEAGAIRPAIVLLEAKSHVPEVYGSGCQATPRSREKIARALHGAKRWCGATAYADWLGPLYQSANRISHLYFLLEELRVPAWLVNLYFTDDPIGPTSRDRWEEAVSETKLELGLTRRIDNMVEVYLGALDSGGVGLKPSDDQDGIAQWAKRWMEPATYSGAALPDPTGRIRHILRLWDEEVPGVWRRDHDLQLMGPRYRRGDIDLPRNGEHRIEHKILCQHFNEVRCLGHVLVDGINALPLVRDERGGRSGNVEADMLLLLKNENSYTIAICEVKDLANNAWYATVENLRQLKLLIDSLAARELFHRRNPDLSLPPKIPFIGLVIAPPHYYSRQGKCANARTHAAELMTAFIAKTGIGVYLARWRRETRAIDLLA